MSDPRRASDLDPLRADLIHVVEQAADEIAQHVDAQGPAGPEIAEHPRQVGNAVNIMPR